jgi:hypothetical protein
MAEHKCLHEYDFGVMATESTQVREDVSEIRKQLIDNGLLQAVAGLRSHVKLLTALVLSIVAYFVMG